MGIELKVGDEFWARQVNGYYGAGGDPQHFTIVGETKTIWKATRTDAPTMTPFNIKKDGSDWEPLPAEDAKKILWLRANANKVESAVSRLARNAYASNVDLKIYETLTAIAALVNY